MNANLPDGPPGAIFSTSGEGAPIALDHEARRLLDVARVQSVPMWLIGGMAIQLFLGESLHPAFRRAVADLDFITPRRHGRDVARLLSEQGWAPARDFNALHGARRLLFYDPRGTRNVDVFVGSFAMCHVLPLLERLDADDWTLPAAELLMTKLQIVELNEKDCYDALALLLGCEVTDHDDGTINAVRIAALTGADWGLYHTVELNLARLRELVTKTPLDAQERSRVAARMESLAAHIAESPKSRAWRLRARIGERKRWYDEPEEADIAP